MTENPETIDIVGWRALASTFAEAGVILGLFALHLLSFGPASAVHGPLEIFAQDSVYLLESLVQGASYPWNPQSHLFHHVLVELGYEAWERVFGNGEASAFRYLKLFSALSGLAFLIALRGLLLELGLRRGQRIAIHALVGVSVAVWFHFSAFETHCLALPALALYLRCLVRLRGRRERSLGDRALLIGSLAFLGWVRLDLLRFALVSLMLPMLPGVEGRRRSLLVDLALVATLALGGNALIASAYFGVPPSDAATVMLDRDDRASLRGQLKRLENLDPRNLITVGRAVTLYSLVMPVDTRPEGRSFLSPPDYQLTLEYQEGEDRPETGLFREPARNLFDFALSAMAFTLLATLLMVAIAVSVRRALSGDLLHVMLVAQAAFGWLLYTWFNPLEPFLWVLEFVPLWIVMIAELLRGRPASQWAWVGVAAVVLGAHNLFAFYLPFR